MPDTGTTVIERRGRPNMLPATGTEPARKTEPATLTAFVQTAALASDSLPAIRTEPARKAEPATLTAFVKTAAYAVKPTFPPKAVRLCRQDIMQKIILSATIKPAASLKI